MTAILVVALFMSVTVAAYCVMAVFGLQIMALRHQVAAGRVVLMTFLAGVMISTSLILFLMIQGSIPVFFVTQAYLKEQPCRASLSAPPRLSAPCRRGKPIL